MQNVRVEVEQLRAILLANRSKHRSIYEEAMDGYQRMLIRHLEKAVEDAKSDRAYKTYFDLTMPLDHTEDYDEALGMLDWHTEATIELDGDSYRTLVMDNWGWKRHFETVNSVYTTS